MSQLPTFALYIHWPWCKAKCPYCDFNSHEGLIQEEAYVEGLLAEMEQWRIGRTLHEHAIPPFTPATRRLGSIFFGGGTPSLMSAESLSRIVQKCRQLGTVDDATEVTVECNPTSFGDKRPAEIFFQELKAAGVNRVSIGIQGLKSEWLSFLGRTHRVDEALATLDAAQAVFGNVNADVIYGLPGQQLEDWNALLRNLAGRGLAHISAYQLTIEQNTRFFKDVRKGLWEPINSDLEADFFDATRETLRGFGYDNYEISNFAQPGMACRHNVHIWNYGEYLGIGAGAHGRVMTPHGMPVATQIVKQPDGYLRRMNDLGDAISVAAPLNGPEAVQEAVFSGLRLTTGVDMEILLKRFGEASCKEALNVPEIDFLISRGLLDANGSGESLSETSLERYFSTSGRHTRFLRLSDAGWPKLNSVLERVLRALPDNSPHHATLPASSPSEYKSGVTVLIE